MRGLSSSSSSDAGLIGVSVSNPQCFAMLFDRHARAIWRYACRRAGLSGADEIVSETFLRAFPRRASYDARRPDARPWLYGIATNVLRERARHEARSHRDVERLPRRRRPLIVSPHPIRRLDLIKPCVAPMKQRQQRPQFDDLLSLT